MGFWDAAKKKPQQAKLQGQILLLDRELTGLQHQLGVDIFSLVFGFAQALHSPGESSESSRDDLMSSVEGMMAIFTAAFEDVHDMVDRRAAADEARDRIEAELGADRAVEKGMGASASNWIGAQSKRAKLTAEIAFLDREILLRKQIFGVQVVEELDLTKRDLSDCPKNELVTLLHRFQAQSKRLMDQRKDYADEIVRLGGNHPTENRSLVLPPEEDSSNNESGHFVQQQQSNEQDQSESVTDEYL